MGSLALFGRSIWAHMDAVSAEAIAAIELELSQKLIRKFNLELRCLIYDTTNFFTFIDTFNAASELAQRGRNKQRRNDLRQVNLALLVTQGVHLPLFHKVYAGKVVFGVERTIVVTFNEKPFVKQVATLERELRKRTQKLAELEAKLKKWHTGESRGGNPPKKQSVEKQVNELLRLRHMKSLIKVDITEATRLPQISYRMDERAYQQLKDTLLGKTIIFTDQHTPGAMNNSWQPTAANMISRMPSNR